VCVCVCVCVIIYEKSVNAISCSFTVSPNFWNFGRVWKKRWSD